MPASSISTDRTAYTITSHSKMSTPQNSQLGVMDWYSPGNYWLHFLGRPLDSFSECLAVDTEPGGLAAESDEKVV
jgi:hypothetical protein